MSLPESASESLVIVLDDETWQELIHLTDGAAAACYQCGVCTAICPWSLVKNEPLSVRGMIRQAQLGIYNDQEELWLCTTCAQCEAYCPRGVDISSVIRALRYLTWERRLSPAGMPTVLWSLFWNNNPWSQPPSQRAQWSQKLELPAFDASKHEILLYIGCTSSYDSRSQNIARSLVKLLEAAEVSYGYLGEDEPCCGETALSVGHKPYFQELAEKALHIFNERNVTRLVVVSPHCYDVFKNHYPQSEDSSSKLIIQHYTEFLAQLIQDDVLSFNRPTELKVAFHDPCYLSRHNGDTTSARMVLSSIPGVELVELEHYGVDTICCGGGGGRMFLETDPAERFADIRIREAFDCQAEVLITACPFCVACLEDSLKASKVTALHVLDVAELSALAL